ncbi:MAG: hypothetical protein ACXWRZ_08215 [Bdellovibrio sp.]
MRNLVTFFCLLSTISTVSFAKSSPALSAVDKCEKVADKAIRSTIKNMGVKDWFNFNIDSKEIVGKSYDDAPIVRYYSRLIITTDGFFPGASAEVVLVARNSCEVSKVVADLGFATPEN